jgi:transcriptional regulator with XRE-family HTH domain
MKALKPRSRIAILREQADLTQLELSQQVGVTETTIANWEKGRSGLEWIERIIRLCWVLQCTPEELIDYIPDSEIGGAQARGLSFTEIRKLMETDELPLRDREVQKIVEKQPKVKHQR